MSDNYDEIRKGKSSENPFIETVQMQNVVDMKGWDTFL